MAEEMDYESDPEEAKLSLKMRRRVASDDENEGEERREKPLQTIDSDGDSDGQGAPADYDDEEEYLEEEEDELLEEEGDYVEEGIEGEGEVEGRTDRDVEAEMAAEGEGEGRRLGAESTEVNGRENNAVSESGDSLNNPPETMPVGKKEHEPYAVPTAGAFYMHDDRFRDNAGGRHRRMLGGRKLWESKDERKWGHDKFEELTMQERQYEEGRRSSRGCYQGRGRSRGAHRGNSRGSRPKSYVDDENQVNNNNTPKSVRGRGPRRYQPSFKNNNDAPPTGKQSGKYTEKPSHKAGESMPASNTDSSYIPATKQTFASSLNYASPPFYPSSSSSKEINLTQKRDAHAGAHNQNVQPPVVDESFPIAQSNSMMRGKDIVDSAGMDKLCIDDSSSAGKSTNLQFAPSGSRSNNITQSQERSQRRGYNSLPQTTYQPSATSNLVNRVPPPTQLHPIQRNSAQSRIQSSTQTSAQQFVKCSGGVSQPSSPPKTAVPINSTEPGELDLPSESSKSKMALIGQSKVNAQGNGKGSYLYGGTQAMGSTGNMNSGHGDQNFPAFFPVMQFGGQRPGGMGVPAVGMAFPGYVGNPQLGNSEMTWLPVLAGAAGALGASYCPPYIAVDGAFHARPSVQAAAPIVASSKENNTNKSNDEWKSSQRPELANDDLGQRQKNPRRYTEMKFDQ